MRVVILNKIYNDYLKIISNIEEKLEKSEQPVSIRLGSYFKKLL